MIDQSGNKHSLESTGRMAMLGSHSLQGPSYSSGLLGREAIVSVGHGVNRHTARTPLEEQNTVGASAVDHPQRRVVWHLKVDGQTFCILNRPARERGRLLLPIHPGHWRHEARAVE
eukprot:scaffold265040_cov28-Tisochrysis_lutea.AAC.2